MSFSSNPYVHMTIATAPPPEARGYLSPREQEIWRVPDLARLGCDSCGASDVAKGQLRTYDSIAIARSYYSEHIRISHRRSPEDMRTWSWE